MKSVVLFTIAFLLVACTTSPTSPTEIGPESVRINSFSIGEVSYPAETLASFEISYDVIAHSCVVMVFEGEAPDLTKIFGGGEVPVRRNGREQVLLRRIRGEHRVELRCVHDPGATTGAIERRTLSIN